MVLRTVCVPLFLHSTSALAGCAPSNQERLSSKNTRNPGGNSRVSRTLRSGGMAFLRAVQHQNCSEEGKDRALSNFILDLAAVELTIGYQSLPKSPLLATPM